MEDIFIYIFLQKEKKGNPVSISSHFTVLPLGVVLSDKISRKYIYVIGLCGLKVWIRSTVVKTSAPYCTRKHSELLLCLSSLSYFVFHQPEPREFEFTPSHRWSDEARQNEQICLPPSPASRSTHSWRSVSGFSSLQFCETALLNMMIAKTLLDVFTLDHFYSLRPKTMFGLCMYLSHRPHSENWLRRLGKRSLSSFSVFALMLKRWRHLLIFNRVLQIFPFCYQDRWWLSILSWFYRNSCTLMMKWC